MDGGDGFVQSTMRFAWYQCRMTDGIRVPGMMASRSMKRIMYFSLHVRFIVLISGIRVVSGLMLKCLI